mmetsp:Transcript_11602/g.10116  ORF Transcript_11602/g.10116 Transcript_11602/m.10116 type:complete len:133 (+) Transcript_11602:797-1195(+)
MIGCKIKEEDKKTIWHIISISESKFYKIYNKQHDWLVNHQRKFLSRMYPIGTRFDSSNYNPIQPWIGGVQMVALNFQTSDEAMLLNYAKFCGNGGITCGYLVKPPELRSENYNNKFKRSPKDIKNPVKKVTI